MTEKLMPAGEFKAKCLSVMDEVRDKRTRVTITKNGAPVAMLVPIKGDEHPDPIFGFYKGKIRIVGDILAPTHTEQEYEEFQRRKGKMYGMTAERLSK